MAAIDPFVLLFAVGLMISLVTLIVTFVTMSINTYRDRRKAAKFGDVTPIPSGKVALIYKAERCVRIERGENYRLGKDESAQFLDLRDRYTMFPPHVCHTLNQFRLTLTPCVIWRIQDINKFINFAPQPHEALHMTILPALARAIARSTLDHVTHNFDDVLQTVNTTAGNMLSPYGIALQSISVSQMEFPAPSPPSDAQKEADFLDALNKVVPNVDEKTLCHAQRIIELKLASAREATADKKA